MAEPFGIVSGAVSIAAVFTTCVDCFNYVQSARRFDRDFQTELLVASMLQNRLSRWGEAVSIYDDPQLGNQEFLVRTVLIQLLALFEDSKKKAAKYSGEHVKPVSNTAIDPRVGAISQEMLSEVEVFLRALSTKRTKGPGLLKTMTWSLHDKQSLVDLNTNISRLLDGLESYIPAKEMRTDLAGDEIEEMRLDQQSLTVLAALSTKVDSLLHDRVARKIEAARTFGEVTLEGKAIAHNGNFMASDFRGSVAADDGGCTFGKIHAKDDVQLHNGWQYGGKSIFDRN